MISSSNDRSIIIGLADKGSLSHRRRTTYRNRRSTHSTLVKCLSSSGEAYDLTVVVLSDAAVVVVGEVTGEDSGPTARVKAS